MSREVVWQPRALDDFDSILDYIAERNPSAADAFELKLNATLELLAQHSIGRRGRADQSFEKPITSTFYTLVYGLSDQTLSVLRIIHQRRDWPDDDWPTS
jgi:toxin ParE1/3/4